MLKFVCLFVALAGCNLFGGDTSNPNPTTLEDTGRDTGRDVSTDVVVTPDISVSDTLDVEKEPDAARDFAEDLERDQDTTFWLPGYNLRATVSVEFPNDVTGIHEVVFRVVLPSEFGNQGTGDLVILDQDGNKIPFDVESWSVDSTSVWVKTSISRESIFTLYSDSADTDASEPDVVWEDYVLMLPFNGNFRSLVDLTVPNKTAGSFEPGRNDEALRGGGEIAYDANPALDIDDPGILSVEVFTKSTFGMDYDQIIVLNEGFCQGYAVQQDEMGYYGQIADNPCAMATYPTAIYREALDDDIWRHILSIFDLNQNTIELYVDGELLAMTQIPVDRSVSTPTNMLRIGAAFDGERPFIGLMDDLMIYKFRKTREQILLSSGLEISVSDIATR